MTFNSYGFILAFLPLFAILYLTLGRIRPWVAKGLLILGSAVFYAFAGWGAAAVLGASLLGNYLLALLIKKTGRKKVLLILAITLNVGLLLYFKYWNFGVEAVNGLTGAAFSHRDLILPLGISFFTFQQIMYAVSVFKGETEPVLSDYLCYVLYFPKLVMGPLMGPKEFGVQLNDPARKRADWGNLAAGIKLFSFGLFKKMLLADTFAKAVAWGFANGVAEGGAAPAATSGDLFLVMLCYTFQIYFDFSGYSDMAVGVSKMLNFDLPINFDSPYKAFSVRDFWKRWHVSLTRFLTEYIYFPLGGSRKGKVRTYANIMAVFLISGLWHGANWTFILWGSLHGLLQIIERLCDKRLGKLPQAARWMGAFFAVNLLWLLFRADSIGQWLSLLRTMFGFQNMAVSDGLLQTFKLPETGFLFDLLHLNPLNEAVRGFSMLLFLAGALLICLGPENNYKAMNRTRWYHMIAAAVAFVWSFLCLSSESVFVYFNF